MEKKDWFILTKDILIPGLTLLSTILLGTIIAFILKNREENHKRKSLLIDTYMNYLDARIKHSESHLIHLFINILNDFLIDQSKFIITDANWHLKIPVIKERLLKEENNLYLSEDNWSFYTYKFCFLLGLKKYRKHLQMLEDDIAENLLDTVKNKIYYDNLVKLIFEDKIITEGLCSSNQNIVKISLDNIKLKIAENYVTYQKKYFQPYDNKVADLINNL